MRKSTLLISATLTAFTLAILVGTASAYREIVSLRQPQIASALDISAEPSPTDFAPAAVPALAPEAAAALAANVIGRTDLYSVETSTFQDVPAFLVTFSSGDLVYVGVDGQILSIGKVPVTVVNQPSSGGGGGGRQGGGGGHESNDGDGDEHEVEDDD